jgi:hypothetical protein
MSKVAERGAKSFYTIHGVTRGKDGKKRRKWLEDGYWWSATEVRARQLANTGKYIAVEVWNKDDQVIAVATKD